MKINKPASFLFDFDGVILDSMNVRDEGFRYIFRNYSSETVEEFIRYHRLNGGLSRYVKIRYFCEQMLNTPITDEEVNLLAASFSVIMKEKLTDKKNLINDAVQFIQNNYLKVPMHIVSGSDGEELRFLCGMLGMEEYFISISGSPVPKDKLIKDVMSKYSYSPAETFMIGDSINDYEAAIANRIQFISYNNEVLRGLNPSFYLNSFKELFWDFDGEKL
jgi:phosphoglycolate phosphatase-like HAD superfamily hydrolase